MDLKKDKQKIYSIEAEYYREHMQKSSQSSISEKLNEIIKVLMGVLLIIILYFSYKMVEKRSSNIIMLENVNKQYVEELAVHKSMSKITLEPIDIKVKEVVMGASVLASDNEKKSNTVPVVTNVVAKSEQKEVVSLVEDEDEISNTDLLSIEYLQQMENALLDSI